MSDYQPRDCCPSEPHCDCAEAKSYDYSEHQPNPSDASMRMCVCDHEESDHENTWDHSSVLYDYSEHQPDPSDASMRTLRNLCLASKKLELQILELEEELRKKMLMQKELLENLIPETMESVGTDVFGGPGVGYQVQVVRRVHASMPTDPVRRKEVLNFIREQGSGALIRTEFLVSYGRGADEHVARFRAALREQGVTEHATVQQSEGVHHSSYAKFVRDLVKEDPTRDIKALGGYRERVAKIRLLTGEATRNGKEEARSNREPLNHVRHPVRLR